MIVCIISTILAPVKNVVLEGYPGYYMGLYAQLSFCMLYFFASNICQLPSKEYLNSKEKKSVKNNHSIREFLFTDRFLEIIPWIIIVLMMIGNTPVMYIGIENALRKDVFRMVEVSGVTIGDFRSTIGNVGILAEYVTVMFIAGAYVFCYSRRIIAIILSGAWLILAYIATISSHAVGSVVGMLAVMFAFLLISLVSPYRFGRYMMMVFLMSCSFAITGKLAYNKDGELQLMTERILLMMTEKKVWLPLMVISIILIFTNYTICRLRQDKKPMRWISWVLRIILLVMVTASFYCLYMYIKMNTEGTLPDWLPESGSSYLIFNENWGAYRPRMWKTILESYTSVYTGDIKLRLFGLGPDNLYILPGMTDLAEIVWGPNSIVAYAHNELINVYVNMGLLGIISYMGIFTVSFIYLLVNKVGASNHKGLACDREFIQNELNKRAEDPAIVIGLTTVFAYTAQGFFGYQWVCVTTAAFIIIGVGVARYRRP